MPENDSIIEADNGSGYRVLARKYRPATFDDLVGQEALVQTLTNAIRLGRVHHAFVLTGVRGVGKTTTARIIAKALNCVGPDGQGGPTAHPCGTCEMCVSIANDRHVDVIEMDAASNTGVDDIREIIDSARYRPVSARNKIYIIDEVHMLSRNAFNALLKTLEEPPDNVIFIFATTEIRKVPVTVLSRCQRFDLRRLDQGALGGLLSGIVEKEGGTVDSEAIDLLARAADGSARDGLSLLDQVLAQSTKDGPIGADTIRELLGLADRSQTLDLFELVMKGDAEAALALLQDMYSAGADPLNLVQDLLETTHWLTRLRILPGAEVITASVSETDRERARATANSLSMPILNRAWQILLKGLSELGASPQPIVALEMLIVRLCYIADLPTPGELVAQYSDTATASGQTEAPQSARTKNGAGTSTNTEKASIEVRPSGPSQLSGQPSETIAVTPAPTSSETRSAAELAELDARHEPTYSTSDGTSGASLAIALEPSPDPAMLDDSDEAFSSKPAPSPKSFEEVVTLFDNQREAILKGHLTSDVHLVNFEPGHIELRLNDAAPSELPNRVSTLLSDWTKSRWVVAVSREAGAPTLSETEQAEKERVKAEAAQHPVVRAVLETFEGAEIEDVKEVTPEHDQKSMARRPEDQNTIKEVT